MATTSCGVASACPMLAEKLQDLQGRIAGAGRVVTLTLDPQTDTLPALRAWADSHHVDRRTWQIGRLELVDLDPLLALLGVVRVVEEGRILHGLEVALLDGRGRLSWRSEGKGWEVADLAARVQQLASAQETASNTPSTSASPDARRSTP